MRNNKIYKLCRIAVLAALYFVLSLLSIKLGNLHITLKFLPLAVSAMLFGPAEAVITALIGEFIYQLCGDYGLSQTTVLWLLAPAVYACVIGVFSKYFGKTDKPIESRYPFAVTVCIAAAILATLTNTAMLYLDSIIWDYYTYAMVFGTFVARLIAGIVAAVVVCIASCEVTRLIKKSKLNV